MSETIKDIMIGMAFMAVYVPAIVAYVMVTDEMLYKVADAIGVFFFPVNPEPKEHADLFAIFWRGGGRGRMPDDAVMKHESISESISDFKARIAAIMRAQGKVIAMDRPCVRMPEDRGYYPPTRKIYDSTNNNDGSNGGDVRNNRGSDVRS